MNYNESIYASFNFKKIIKIRTNRKKGTNKTRKIFLQIYFHIFI
jgi:hypothetical protein